MTNSPERIGPRPAAPTHIRSGEPATCAPNEDFKESGAGCEGCFDAANSAKRMSSSLLCPHSDNGTAAMLETAIAIQT